MSKGKLLRRHEVRHWNKSSVDKAIVAKFVAERQVTHTGNESAYAGEDYDMWCLNICQASRSQRSARWIRGEWGGKIW